MIYHLCIHAEEVSPNLFVASSTRACGNALSRSTEIVIFYQKISAGNKSAKLGLLLPGNMFSFRQKYFAEGVVKIDRSDFD